MARIITMIENFFRLWNPHAGEIEDTAFIAMANEYQKRYNDLIHD